MSTFFFFNDTATTEIYTLSLHDALPISFDQLLCCRMDQLHLSTHDVAVILGCTIQYVWDLRRGIKPRMTDRKSTRLNSSHSQISYAVFCLKKKKQIYLYDQCFRPLCCED